MNLYEIEIMNEVKRCKHTPATLVRRLGPELGRHIVRSAILDLLNRSVLEMNSRYELYVVEEKE